jgi:hypothetical protein
MTHSLLTLTSFPFRILHANDAYCQMTGRQNVMGETFYDMFHQEGVQCPSIVGCPTPLGKLDQETVRLKKSCAAVSASSSQLFQDAASKSMIYATSSNRSAIESKKRGHEKNEQRMATTSSSSLFAKIQVFPIYKAPRHPEQGLKYYVVLLEELHVPPPGYIGQPVYLPMPSGCIHPPKSMFGEPDDGDGDQDIRKQP